MSYVLRNLIVLSHKSLFDIYFECSNVRMFIIQGDYVVVEEKYMKTTPKKYDPVGVEE